MMKKQNFICATEKMIDFEKSDYIVGLFLVENVILLFNLTNIIFNCDYIK